MEEQKQQECTAQTQELLELGASTTKSSRGNIYTLTIIGQIEGHQVLPETVKTTKYEHVIPLLAAVEESEEIDGLLLLLNTVGGDIEEEAYGVAGSRRRAFDRHSAGGVCETGNHRAAREHDRSPRAHDGAGGRRAADVSLL